MKRKLVLLFVSIITVLALVACNSNAPKTGKAGEDGVKTMAGADLEKLENDNKAKDGVLVVDVRGAEEYSQGHVKHAINVSLEDIKDGKGLKTLEVYKDKPIILYCNTGKRSGEAAKVLVKGGYTDVTNAAGVKDYKYNNLTTYSNITGAELVAKSKDSNVLIVDVRPKSDYDKGHIEGAVNVPFDALDANISKLPKDKELALYCFTGNKSSDVAKELVEKGYSKVNNSVEGTKEYNFDLVPTK